MLIGLILFFSWLNHVPKAARSQFINRILLAIAIGIGVLLIARGLHPLLAALGALLPLLPRLVYALKTIKTLKVLIEFIQRLGRGKTSNTETRWLRIKSDPRNSEIRGKVLAGHHRGKLLAQLTIEELLQVLAECYERDRPSVAILETYLDHRGGGKNWREKYNDNTQKGPEIPLKTGKMTITDAYEILGLPLGSNRKEVISAYRSLIQKLHPDRGGSSLLAIQINKAKDLLLNSLSSNE
uniref:DnaJ domain-containing protein n=1 Tax=Candidatus Kentrum sp. LFY TaxID=2126342 RepID=A0A450WU32_9GAMM|nr:MAG: DnaJ domain-containing protein [Candidatus Kentron sp. LFY]